MSPAWLDAAARMMGTLALAALMHAGRGIYCLHSTLLKCMLVARNAS